MLRKNSKIFIAGHNGLVGSSILQLLKKNKYNKILLRNRNQLDLTDFKKVDFHPFKKVDFPTPEGPIMEIISFSLISNLIFSKIENFKFLYL